VRRSGTTLLRVMLDRHPELAVPDESYFVPQLADRHRKGIDVDAFLDDLRRLPTLDEWGVSLDDVRRRLRPGLAPGDAIAVVYQVYAEGRGKRRWGDKTPLYMQHLPLLERLFPAARFVHLIRDGRDAALSFLEVPEGIITRTWAHPRSAGDFACQWRSEVEAARRLGARVGPDRYLEARYEQLVAEPAATLERICSFAGLAFEPAMLEYAGAVDVSAKPHQQSLTRPPTPGLRRWRDQMAPKDVAAFEAVAGRLLEDLGYEIVSGRPSAGARLSASWRRASYRARLRAWRGSSYLLRRSPGWRRRHPPRR